VALFFYNQLIKLILHQVARLWVEPLRGPEAAEATGRNVWEVAVGAALIPNKTRRWLRLFSDLVARRRVGAGADT
jgi:hypothetical protein